MRKKLKIVFTNIMLGMHRGGGENVDLNLIRGLSEQGHEIELLFLRPFFSDYKEKDFPEGVKLKQVRSPWLYMLSQKLYKTPFLGSFRGLRGLPRFIGQTIFEFLAFLKIYFRKDKELMVHACGLCIFGYLVKTFTNYKVFIRLPGPVHYGFEKKCLEKVDVIFANGNAYEKMAPLFSHNLSYLEIGVNSKLFHPREKHLLREKLGLDKEELILFTVGRLSKIKNISIQIEAIAELKKKSFITRLLIAGDGPEEQFLKDCALKNGCLEQITFLGKQAPSALAEFYAASDIFLISSTYDNFPNVVLEAMSSGLPVIGSRVGGIPLQVENGKNGFLFDSEDKEQLVQAIFQYIDHSDLLKLHSENALALVQKKYSWEETVRNIEKKYSEV